MKTVIFGKQFELEKMPDAQLAKMVGKLWGEIRRLEGRVDAIQDQFVAGEYIGPDGEAPPWFGHLCRSLDRHRVALIAVEGEIGRRSAAPATPTLAEIFMDICAQKMAPDLYSRVMAMAQKRLAKAEAEQEPTP
jgi:hypothetical protein